MRVRVELQVPHGGETLRSAFEAPDPAAALALAEAWLAQVRGAASGS